MGVVMDLGGTGGSRGGGFGGFGCWGWGGCWVVVGVWCGHCILEILREWEWEKGFRSGLGRGFDESLVLGKSAAAWNLCRIESGGREETRRRCEEVSCMDYAFLFAAVGRCLSGGTVESFVRGQTNESKPQL